MALDPVAAAAVRSLGGEIAALNRRIARLENGGRTAGLKYSSIDGGALVVNDANGAPRQVIGAQPDGTVTVTEAGASPPAAPSAPVVAAQINGLVVGWDGLLGGGGPLSDFLWTEVHVSTAAGFTPSPATLTRTLHAGGIVTIAGLAAGTAYYVVLVAVNRSRTASPPSAQGTATPLTATQAIPPNSIGAGLLQIGILVAGIIDGTIVTGTTLQNSGSNPRTAINPDGSIYVTNAAGIAVLMINPDGSLHWHDGTTGNLLMDLAPGGTQIIYSSETAPAVTDFEPPSAPAVLLSTNSAASAGSYVSAVTQATTAGQVITVVASAAGATAATGVTDTQGNTYTLVQSATTAAPYQQVFQAVNAAALATTDTITVAYAAANTQQKNIIALATSFVPTVTPLDFSAQATGTSTAPSVTGTPTAYGDALIFIASWATAGGAGTIPDGWQQAISNNIAGQQWTQAWYSVNIAGSGSVTASATITSAAWSGVLLGYKASPAQPLTAAPASTAATLSASTAWADDGTFSAKVTKVGTATTWGITYPPFPVQPGSYIASRIVIGTLNIALGAVEIGFTYWSGPGGTGTNLGNSLITPGALGFNAFWAWTIYNSLVPPTAQSATFYVMEKQADTAGQWFLVDGQSVPGGLAYSNSPVATDDGIGNPIPQGINFVGLPQLTDTFGITDPYRGTKLANIDGQGNITGQTVSAGSDLAVRGQSVPDDLIAPLPLGLVNYGYMAVGATAWPGTAIGTTEVPLWELDADLTGGRVYEFIMNQTIINTGGAASAHLRLRYTTDGSTPTTSSPIATLTASRCETASTDALIGPLRCIFAPGADATYRFLITGNTGASTFQFKNDTFVRMAIYDLGGNTGQVVNNLTVLGTGSSGGASAQAYTEYFYPLNTYSYDGWGLRNHNGSMFQGTYNSGYDQHSWIQWANGSRGNGLSTVLNYSVTSVKLRLLNLHSWYNSGMTVSVRYGNAGVPGGTSDISAELTSYHINEGQLLAHTLASADWAAWKTAGRWTVLKAGSTSLDRYGYFYGKGATGSMPQLQVKYTH